MAKTIANVLVGVAKLLVRQPNDAIAEWDPVNHHLGSYSVKLTKTGTGNAGGTSFTVIPPAITFASWHTNIAIAGKNSFWYLYPAGVTANFLYIGYRFDDPDSDNGHVEITSVPFQNFPGTGIWKEYDELTDAKFAGYYGEDEEGNRMDDWAIDTITLANVKNAIDGAVIDGDAGNWVLTKVFYTLFETTPARYACIDDIVINGVPYTVEPGGDAPGMYLSSPFEEVGYTEDGVTMEYAAEQADIMVHEETFPVGSALTSESLTITCNMAESSLANLNNAMAGAVLLGSKITLGAGVNKTMNLKIEGTNPAGFHRAIHIPLAVAGGTVAMSYKKGEKTIVPVTFKALKGDEPACTIVDNIA